MGLSFHRLCGSNPPEPIASSSNKMVVVFQSDASVHYGGFIALYTSLPKDKSKLTISLQLLQKNVRKLRLNEWAVTQFVAVSSVSLLAPYNHLGSPMTIQVCE